MQPHHESSNGTGMCSRPPAGRDRTHYLGDAQLRLLRASLAEAAAQIMGVPDVPSADEKTAAAASADHGAVWPSIAAYGM